MEAGHVGEYAIRMLDGGGNTWVPGGDRGVASEFAIFKSVLQFACSRGLSDAYASSEA